MKPIQSHAEYLSAEKEKIIGEIIKVKKVLETVKDAPLAMAHESELYRLYAALGYHAFREIESQKNKA